MKILTKKNGIALVAVLTVLLVLTLLLPVMFTLSERATRSAMKGQDQQRASYLARTSCEMAVAAFEDFYTEYDEANTKYLKALAASPTNPPEKTGDYEVIAKFDTFTTAGSMKASTVYMYVSDSYTKREDIKKEIDEGNWETYQKNAVKYSVDGKPIAGYSIVGHADCMVTYKEDAEFYKVVNGVSTKIDEATYNTLKNTIVQDIKDGNNKITSTNCFKIDRKEVRFEATATIGEKEYKDFTRACLVILPTKPAQESWIVPAEISSNQIFPVTESATGVLSLDYSEDFNKGNGGSGAISQAVYCYSCAGNMVITGDGLTIPATNEDGTPVLDDKGNQVYVDYAAYCATNNMPYNSSDLSLGVYPETTTLPEDDPTFACLKTNNMRSWATSAQKDNFIMFNATNGIQVDLPVNLIINPCRTGRIGDGIQRNQSLYKVMAFQAPDIVFKSSVNSMISLWTKTSLSEILLDTFQPFGIEGYDARRVTSIILSAPENTHHSYLHSKYGVVKAGKVYFMEDAYIWVIPHSENGSNWKTQSVYYKGSDIKLYKVANAGDVYYFNSEVPTGKDGETTGFSLSAYFMDVKYRNMVSDSQYGWKLWSKFKDSAFGFAQNAFKGITYHEDDFRKDGNIYDGDDVRVPAIDDIYVVWDS